MNRRRRGIGLSLLLGLGLALLEGCASGPPPTPIELAEQALIEEDWRTAQSQFAIALRADPGSGRAWLGQARAQLGGRDPEAALTSLGQLARVDRARFLGDAQQTYADALEGATRQRLAGKQVAAAYLAARALAKVDPERRGLHRLLGKAILAEADRLRLLGDPQSALPLFQEATRVVPESLEAWVGAAEIMIESRQGKDAVRLLEAARQYHPTAGEIRMLTIHALSAR